MLNRIVLSVVLFLAFVAGASAFDTPSALLKSLYKPYLADSWHEDEMVFFSTRTHEDWEALLAADPYGLGFSPIVDGQDYDLTALDIVPMSEEADTALYRVTFANFGAERDLLFTLVREPSGWLIDDIEARHGDFPWRLRALIAQATSAAP